MATAITNASFSNGTYVVPAAGDYSYADVTATTGGEKIILSAGNDTLTYAAAVTDAQTTYAGAGNDSIDGALLTVKLTAYGGDGNDSIAGGTVDDVLYGGAGNDSIWGNAGADTLYGDEGADILVGGAGANKLYGGAGNDFLDNSAGTVVAGYLSGDDGNDTIIGSALGDSIYGGAGNDIVTIATGTVGSLVDGGDGNDILTANPNAAAVGDTLLGGAGADTITGGVGADSIVGGDGNDKIVATGAGAAGADTIIGGAGNEYIDITGNTDNATIIFDGGADTITGALAGDKIKFNVTADKLSFAYNTAGNVVITAGDAGTVTVDAATLGTATINVKNADGTDTVFGANFGTTADDTAATDVDIAAYKNSYAFAGNDELNAATATDLNKATRIDGGAGTDTITTAAAVGAVSINLYDSKFVSVENINNAVNGVGGSYLRGDKAGTNNLITATNAVAPGATGDQLWGGTAGTGTGDADTLVGGSGIDTFWFGKGDGKDIASGFTTNDIINLYNVSRNDLTFTRSGNDLLVAIKGTTDVLTIKGYNVAGAAALTFKDASGVFTFSYTDATDTTKATIIYDPAATTIAGSDGVTDTVKIAAAPDSQINLFDAKFVSIENIDHSTNVNAAYLRGDKAGTNNVITAGIGGDNIWGGSGADSDTLVGGINAGALAGNDIFWFGKNDGNDVITSYQTTDVVNLYNVGSASELTWTLSGDNLVGTIAATGDSVTLVGYNAGAAAVSPTFQLSDGSQFAVAVGTDSAENITSTGVVVAGAGSDVITKDPLVADVYIDGGAGTDTYILANADSGASINLYDTTKFKSVENVTNTGTVSTYLRGTVDNNILTASATLNAVGDELWGGTGGNDTMVGGVGADSFWFGTGDGKDVVTQTANAAGLVDKVMLYSEGLTSSNVTGTVVNNTNLVLTLASGETLTINGFSTATQYVFGSTANPDNSNVYTVELNADLSFKGFKAAV